MAGVPACARPVDPHARSRTRERGEIPLATYDVLVQLAEAPDHRLRMTDLADRVLLSRSGLTRMIDRLEREELVRREPCADDARGMYAVLDPCRRRPVAVGVARASAGRRRALRAALQPPGTRAARSALGTVGRLTLARRSASTGTERTRRFGAGTSASSSDDAAGSLDLAALCAAGSLVPRTCMRAAFGEQAQLRRRLGRRRVRATAPRRLP